MRGLIVCAALLAASCGGGGDSGGSAVSVQGRWDVTFTRTDYSGGTLTINGGTATLTLVERGSGAQREIAVSLSGNSGTGTVTKIVNGQRTLESTFTVTAPSSSFESLDGDWKIMRSNTVDATAHFAGGSFNGTGSASLGSVSYTFNGTIAGGILTGTDSSGSEFAAMRR